MDLLGRMWLSKEKSTKMSNTIWKLRLKTLMGSMFVFAYEFSSQKLDSISTFMLIL
jgi:hypothetical protein